MKIKDADKGKKYLVDELIVATLVDVMVDNFAKVEFNDGRHASVAVGRLSPLKEKKDDKSPLDYHQMPVKVSVDIYDSKTGETFTKYLDGDEALKWGAMLRELCWKAQKAGINPRWIDLEWKRD